MGQRAGTDRCGLVQAGRNGGAWGGAERQETNPYHGYRVRVYIVQQCKDEYK
jgi:hypothetical protein